MPLEEKVGATIKKYGMFSGGDRVLLGVSGGPDSVALLHVMSRLRGEYDLHLEVAHLIHGIRKEEDTQDAMLVAEQAERLAIPFHQKEVDLPQVRLECGGGNVEALGRRERYQFFAALAEEGGLNKVATAHTRDDQAETLLMWLLRGSGRRGLSGISPLRPLPLQGSGRGGPLLVRPLIEASRDEVMIYLRGGGLEFRTDRTNRDTRRLRNWIRHCLLPQLRDRTGRGLDERLARTVEILREEERLLDGMTEREMGELALDGRLVRGPLLQEEKAIQRRLLRRWLEATLGDLRGLGFNHVEAILKLASEGPPQGRLSLPGGWELARRYETIRLARRERIRPECPSYCYPLPREGELTVPEARVKLRSTCKLTPRVSRPQDDLEALFDATSLPGALTVRNFRPGDRYQPLGMQGHKKVKDLFIEKKVPLSVRRHLPLLLCGEEILWVPRYGRSERAKAGPQTREILTVRLVPLEGSPL